MLAGGTWTREYILQNGLNIGVPYSVERYPAALDPATGGCRNITGQNNDDGTVTIYAVTSTVSSNGDTGADPNKLVKVTDRVSDTTLPPANSWLGRFETIRSSAGGRGVPRDRAGADGVERRLVERCRSQRWPGP